MESSTLSTRKDEDDIVDAVKGLSVNHSSSSSPPSTHAPFSYDTNLSRSSPTTKRRTSKPTLHRRSSASIHGVVTSPDEPASLLRKASASSLSREAAPAHSPTTKRIASSPVTNKTISSQDLKGHTTAGSFAREYLEKYLSRHQELSSSGLYAQTALIVQDDCYGHRYARPKISKAGLSTIVERPERISAALFGAAAAFVRLGGLHAGGSAAPTSNFDTTSVTPAPFSIIRSSRRVPLNAPAVTAVHGAEWMAELSAMCDSAESKLATGGKELSRPASSDKSGGPPSTARPKLHEGDLYLCSKSLHAFEGAIGGVCDAVDKVFSENRCKRCFVCIRPPGHHCSSDLPSGFCWLNNVHIGISHAAIHHGLTHAAIIDFDLHHGDGSQTIAWAHNAKMAALPKNAPMNKKRPIGYFSLHDINSYPCEGGDEEKIRGGSLCIENAHGQSIWNIHLQSWKTEAEFWELYESRYRIILDKARSFLRSHSDRLREHPTRPAPKAAIFFSAGFDASEWESPHMQRHQVNVPTSFYERITRDVGRMANEEGLGVDGRIISVLEGGYSDRALISGVMSHMCGLVDCGLVRNGHSSHAPVPVPGDSRSTSSVTTTKLVDLSDTRQAGRVDPAWWNTHHLGVLEDILNPKAAPEAPKKRRSDVKPTYTSATESYKAKIVSPTIGRRSLSGVQLTSSATFSESRPPTPPPPEVDWATAAVELGRILVPADRETASHRSEELNAEATRARREKVLGRLDPSQPEPVESGRMHLREKRVKASSSSVDPAMRPPSRTSRRRTIADVTALVAERSDNPPVGQAIDSQQKERVTRRRSSAASSITSAISDADHRLTTPTERTVISDSAVKNAVGDSSKPRVDPQKTRVTRRPLLSRTTSRSSISTDIPEEDNTDPSAQKTQIDSIAEDRQGQQDFDQLASSMKKMSIKLNVPSREEHDARQKAKMRGKVKQPAGAADRKLTKPPMPAKSRTKISSPSKSQGKGNSLAGSLQKSVQSGGNPTTVAVGEERTSIFRSTHQQVAGGEATSDSLVRSEPEHFAVQDEASPDVPSGSKSIVPLAEQTQRPNKISNGPSLDSVAVAQPTQVHSSIPHSFKRTKDHLPTFTSTSPIRFAAHGVNNPEPSPEIVDVDTKKDTPIRPLSIGPTTGPSQTSPASKPTDAMTKKDIEGSESRSIWDVPETPQLRKPLS